MPLGIIIDSASVAVGGIIGCLIGTRLTDRWKGLLNNLLGIAAIIIGILLIIRTRNMSPVILSMIIGALIGEAFRLEKRVNRLTAGIVGRLMKGSEADESYLIQMSAVIVLFCFSGSGWYGSLYEGMTGDGTILITKAILDGITALIFAALLGKIIPFLCIPQICIFLILFLVSGLVAPLITDSMIGDFSAVGGILTFVAGLRMSRIKTDLPVLNLLPALPLAFVISGLWTAFIG